MINKFKITEDDLAFKNQMERCGFPVSDFNHRAHIRLAYIYLTDNNAEKSPERMRDTLRRFLHHNGVDPSKYHVTLTKAWTLAVHHFMNKTGRAASADEFIEKNPEMLDTNIMMTHYSEEVLFSDMARVSFVQPNLDPIPRYNK